MKSSAKIVAALLVLSAAAQAQAPTQMTTEMAVTAGRENSSASEKRPKPTAEQQKRGRQMLEAAEAQAAGLEGGMRAYALCQVARMVVPTDRKKALELLEGALTAARGMEDDKANTRAALERQILQEMVPLAPQRVDEAVSQVDAEARGPVLNAMVNYYQKNQQLDRAVEVLYRLAQEGEMPYGATARVMAALPEEKSSDAQQLFQAALDSFEKSKPSGRCLGDCDFAVLVTRFWKRLPRQSVLDAIHAMLKQAKDSNQGQISMASGSGAVAFNSYYEFRLFQLLPVLRQLDESEAKKLLQEYQQVQTLLAKYPEGTGSLQARPEAGGSVQAMPATSFMVGGPGGRPGGGGGGGSSRRAMPSPLEMQQVMKISAEAEKHPREALAMCAGVSDSRLRAQALQGIAGQTWKNEASVAREALQKLLEVIPDLETQEQMMALNSAAGLYLDMGESEDAKKVVEKGLKAADKAFAKDSNADDPNKALKAYWPSAEGYRSMLRVAARISPVWATSLLKEISDPEMKVLVQIAMAGALLDVPVGPVTIMSSTKDGTLMMNRTN